MGKGIIKYGFYFCAGLWMFTLGVMVGRGTSPVTFDTRGIQSRLGDIARAYTNQVKTEPKVALGFYDALNNPVRHEVKGRPKKSGEILPIPEPVKIPGNKGALHPDDLPVKRSKKYESLDREGVAELKKEDGALKTRPAPMQAAETVTAEKTVSKTKKPLKAKKSGYIASSSENTDRYTIQVAAYKAFKDAVSQMAALEKKGIEAYRIKGEKDGATWYRVRTGAFHDYQTAAARLRELKKARVNGMIIKKEER